MPLNGRQMTALITASGGSSPAPGGDFTGSKYSYQTISVSVAGGMGNTTEWKLDGGDNDDYMSNGNLPFPFPDAVAQFSVESTNLGAQMGKHSGGLVNVVTRSGTNSYHGSAFEFIRNNYVDATSFFSTSTDKLHQNQFGGTFGGPILRNRLFAFAGYQRLMADQATANVQMYIPTAANLAGDWSATDAPCPTPTTCTGSEVQLIDPLTGVPIPGNKYATQPVYNAASLALEKYFPAVNAATASAPGQVSFAVPSQTFDNQFVTRVDYNINAKHNLYARYMIDGYQSPSFFSPTDILITYLAPGNYERVQTATLGEAWTLTSNMVNSFHLSGSKRVNLRQSAPGINAGNIGVTSYTEVPTGLQITTSTSGKTTSTGTWSTYCGTCSPGHFNVDNEGFSDDLNIVKGSHQFVIGGEFVRVHFNEVAAYEANGTFSFSGIWSGNGPGGGTKFGDANLDFLWGAQNTFQQSKEQQLALRASVPSAYIQDTYHASKRLTIVAGLRWEPEYMPFDYYKRGSTFDMAAFQANKISSIYPTAPAGSFFWGDPGVPAADTQSSPWQFNPNFGASWDPFGNGNTVIRGGFGLAYDLANFYTTNRNHQNPPFATASSPNISGPVCFSEPWLVGGTGYGCAQVGGTNSSPYPQPVVPVPSQAVFPAQGQFIVLPKQFHVSDTLQWTLSVQHEFGKGWQAQVMYIGNHTANMPTGLPLDLAIYQPGNWGPAGTGCGNVQISGPAAVAAGTVGGGAVGTACSTIKNQQARFALTEANPGQGNQYTGGGGGTVLVDDVVWANYNGMVASLQHRLSSNFNMLSNFTWSHCLNVSDAGGDVTGTSTENPYNFAVDYARCGSDYRKIFNTTVVYKTEFPIHGFARAIVNDWEIAPLIHILSGGPINVTDGTDISLTDDGLDRPNIVPGVNPINYASIRKLNSYATRSYLNPAAFTYTNVAPGAFGNLRRNAINGPMYFGNDAQISRLFPIKEKLTVDARIEAFNFMNHPNFSNPASANPTSATFGEISATNYAGSTTLTQRVFQGSMKIIF